MATRQVVYYENKWSPEAKRNIKVEAGKAIFHQFGVNFEELEGGIGSFSTAIIEKEDGTVENIYVEYIRFIQEAS